MKNKKLLTLGALTVGIAPLFTVMSCGSKTPGLSLTTTHKGTAAEIISKVKNKEIWLKTSLGGETNNKYVQENIFYMLKSINSNDINNNEKNLSALEIKAMNITSKIKLNESLQDVDIQVKINNTSENFKIKVGLNPVVKNKLYAPYFDIGAIHSYNINSIKAKYGINTITAAFLQHMETDKATTADPVGWSWNGVSIDKNPKAQAQFAFLDGYKKVGGNYIISFGGANGVPGWNTSFGFNVEQLVKSFNYIIDTYNPIGFDFDIEGGQMDDTAGNLNLIKSMEKIHKSHPDLKISYTIAVDPIHNPNIIVNPNFNESFKNILNSNFKPIINCMAMDFADPVKNMATPIINSIKGIAKRIKEKGSWGVTSLKDAYKMIGVTPMLGMNDTLNETANFKNIMDISHFASINKMPLFSNWSLTRDNGNKPGKGGYASSGMYQEPYQFSTNILNCYGDKNENIEPVKGKLKLEKYSFFKHGFSVKFSGVTNAYSYKIYLNNKLITKASSGSKGFSFYNKSYFPIGKNNLQIIALGAQGSTIASNEINFDNSKKDVLNNPIIYFDKTNTYYPGDLVFYKGQVVKVKWYKNPNSDFAPYQYNVLGTLDKYKDSLSADFIKNFNKGESAIPSWYFHNSTQK